MTDEKHEIGGASADAFLNASAEPGADGDSGRSDSGRQDEEPRRRIGGGGGSWNTARANMVLVVLYAAAIGCVYMMSFRCKPPTASAEQSAVHKQVDSELSRLQNLSGDSALKGKRASEVVEAFYRNAKGVQVPSESLGGNPFAFTPPRSRQTPPQKETRQKTQPKDDSQSEDAAEAMAAADELVLQSVLTGSHGAMAMISKKTGKSSGNSLIAAGQKINGWTVVKVYPNRVVLKWRDRTYVLKMSR